MENKESTNEATFTTSHHQSYTNNKRSHDNNNSRSTHPLVEWKYLAILDYEANCIPDVKSDPLWKDKFDFTPFQNFKSEIIEIPTVVMTRVEEAVKSSTTSEVGQSRANDIVESTVQEEDQDPSPITTAEYKITNEFRSFVQPTLFPNITTFCTSLTGITQEQIETPPLGGRKFKSVFRNWLTFASQYPQCLIVTCGDWDLRQMLPQQLKYSNVKYPTGNLLSRWCNVKVCFRELYGQKAGSMTQMLNFLNLPLEGRHHSGIDDCRNIARIVKRMLRDGGERSLEDNEIIFVTSYKSREF